MHLIFMTLASLDFFVIETCQKYHFSNKTIAILLNKYMMDLKILFTEPTYGFRWILKIKTKYSKLVCFNSLGLYNLAARYI